MHRNICIRANISHCCNNTDELCLCLLSLCYIHAPWDSRGLLPSALVVVVMLQINYQLTFLGLNTREINTDITSEITHLSTATFLLHGFPLFSQDSKDKHFLLLEATLQHMNTINVS